MSLLILLFQGVLALTAAAPAQSGAASAAKSAPAPALAAHAAKPAFSAAPNSAASAHGAPRAHALAPALRAAQPALPGATPRRLDLNSSSTSAARPAHHPPVAVVPALRHSAPQARPTEKIAVVHTAVQPAAETAVHASGHAAVQPEKPVERPRFRGAGRGSAQPSSRRPASPPKHHSYLGPAPSQHAGNTLGDSKEDLLKEEIDSSKIFSILPAFLFAPFASSNSMSLWVTAFLVIAIVAIVLFLCMLVRFIQDGYEVHWMAGLPARTDWQHLSNGDFVKVVGHVVALPAREVVSPLTRTPCVAYSVSAGRCDSSKSGKKSVMQVKSFCVQDDQGRMILIQGHEAVLYNLTTAKEWNYLAGSVPKEFHSFSPKVDHDAGEFTLLRFREEVLEVGAKVCCVGAVSTLPNPHAPISLRPAYATLMFRDAQIPWSKLEGLSTSDWGKVASSVLVTSYRLGR